MPQQPKWNTTKYSWKMSRKMMMMMTSMWTRTSYMMCNHGMQSNVGILNRSKN